MFFCFEFFYNLKEWGCRANPAIHVFIIIERKRSDSVGTTRVLFQIVSIKMSV